VVSGSYKFWRRTKAEGAVREEGKQAPLAGKVYKFKFDLQPGSLTVQVAVEHQPSKKTFISSEIKR